MRIAIVISSLQQGGTENVALRLAKGWREQGHQMTITTFFPAESDFYKLPEAVIRHDLSPRLTCGTAITRVCRRVQRLREHLLSLQPDVVVAFGDITSVTCIAAMMGTSIPVIATERNDPREIPINRAWSIARQLLYPYSAAIVVQTESVKQWACKQFPNSNVYSIGNPLPENEYPVASIDAKKIISTSRLVEHKQVNHLITAFSKAAQIVPDWTLDIVGDGPEHKPLLRQCEDLGIQSTVTFHGRTTDVFGVLKSCSVFAMSSQYEGFPNSLLEAMAVGLCPVCTDCRSGPSEIMKNGLCGELVPVGDIEAMTAGLVKVMSSTDLRRKYSDQSLHVRYTYSMSSVLSQWNSVFNDIKGIAKRMVRRAS